MRIALSLSVAVALALGGSGAAASSTSPIEVEGQSMRIASSVGAAARAAELEPKMAGIVRSGVGLTSIPSSRNPVLASIPRGEAS